MQHCGAWIIHQNPCMKHINKMFSSCSGNRGKQPWIHDVRVHGCLQECIIMAAYMVILICASYRVLVYHWCLHECIITGARILSLSLSVACFSELDEDLVDMTQTHTHRSPYIHVFNLSLFGGFFQSKTKTLWICFWMTTQTVSSRESIFK